MGLNYLLIYLFLFFLLNGIKIREILRIGDRPGTEILEVFDVCTDNNGNIYVSDKLEYAVKKFDKNGNLILKVGGKGQGPGEFRVGPGAITCAGDIIAVVDFTTSIIHLFTKDLKFIKLISTPSAISDITSDKNGNIYAAYVNFKGGKFSTEIAIFNKSGQNIKVIKVGDGFLNAFLGFARLSCSRDYLVLNYFCLNQIFLIDKINGKIVKKFSIMGLPEKSKFEKMGEIEVPEENMFNDIAVNPSNEHIFILSGGYSKNPGKDIYILDKKGSLLQTVVLPEKTKFIYFDHEGYLYTSGKENTILKKIKLTHYN